MSTEIEMRTDWETTSFSELSTLAECEEKWYRRYVLREPTESGPAMFKGTLFHEGTGVLLMGGTLEQAVGVMYAQADEVFGPDRAVWDPKMVEAVETAVWLVQRYSRHYAVQLKQVKVVAHELRLTREMHFPTRDGVQSVTIKSDLDTLLDIDGKLWLREAKSSGRRDILETTHVSPQITLYWWQTEGEKVLADLGYPEGLYGVLLDYAYTYRWKLQKPTQGQLIEEAERNGQTFVNKKAAQEWARIAVANHPGIEAHSDSESFDQQWLDRTVAQVEAGVQWAQNILERRYTLTQSLPGRPPTMRNIGQACKFCDHKGACYGEMAFPQDDISLDLS